MMYSTTYIITADRLVLESIGGFVIMSEKEGITLAENPLDKSYLIIESR